MRSEAGFLAGGSLYLKIRGMRTGAECGVIAPPLFIQPPSPLVALLEGANGERKEAGRIGTRDVGRAPILSSEKKVSVRWGAAVVIR
jgi:hypothetical protein